MSLRGGRRINLTEVDVPPALSLVSPSKLPSLLLHPDGSLRTASPASVMVVDVRATAERADGCLANSIHLPARGWQWQQRNLATNETSRAGVAARGADLFPDSPGLGVAVTGVAEIGDEDEAVASACEAFLREAAAAGTRTVKLIFHCMYSKERGPAAARTAMAMLAAQSVGQREGGGLEVALLEGGFQQCMAQLWGDGDGGGRAGGQAGVDGVAMQHSSKMYGRSGGKATGARGLYGFLT